mgnify:FL=1|tara:strand:- start:5729 stop:6340 length:612 start_codon:yes stop_codon:yes gene_type:complete
MLKIAVSGKMGAGKTTLTNLIQQHHEMNQPKNDNFFNQPYSCSRQLSLATPVKKVAHDYFLMPETHKDRPLLQKIGQQFRNIRSSVWIDLLIVEANEFATDFDNHNIEGCLVCDDVRFPNELDALRKDGWFLIRLEVDDEIRKKRINHTYPHDAEIHWDNRNEISETALDDYEGKWDLVLTNPDYLSLKGIVEEFYTRLSHSA